MDVKLPLYEYVVYVLIFDIFFLRNSICVLNLVLGLKPCGIRLLRMFKLNLVKVWL